MVVLADIAVAVDLMVTGELCIAAVPLGPDPMQVGGLLSVCDSSAVVRSPVISLCVIN